MRGDAANVNGFPMPYDFTDLATGRLAIVGNAPDCRDHSAAIDGADRVVRFNNAAGFAGRSGVRLDWLALVNRGGQMREWLDDPGFLDRPVIRAARTFLFPFPALPPERAGTGDGACWTQAARSRLSALTAPIHILPTSLHQDGARLLAADAEQRPNPSTGFLVTLAILRDRNPGAPPIDVYGFGFSGWPGHPWAAERHWFAAQERLGRLRLHPPDESHTPL
jgi:hypothetical protein